MLEVLHELLARIHFVEEGSIPLGTWIEGRRLCHDVDLKDAPFVTLVLHLDGYLWTLDHELKAGLRARSFNSFSNRDRLMFPNVTATTVASGDHFESIRDAGSRGVTRYVTAVPESFEPSKSALLCQINLPFSLLGA